jgi:hypothetical protein
VGDLGDLLEVRDVQLGVADRLEVNGRVRSFDAILERLDVGELTNLVWRPSLGKV